MAAVVPSAGIVGRDAELAKLAGFLDELAGPWLVEVTGDAGIGKTTVLDRFATHARAGNAIVLAGQPAADTPFGLFADAFAEQHDAVRAALAYGDPDWCAKLVAILPSVAAPQPASSPDAAHRVVWVLLERLAHRPLVLVLDDVHLADDASLALLAALLRRPPVAPVLILLGYRDRQAGRRLRAALRSPQVKTVRVRLGPLTEADVDRLLAGEGSTSWRLRLYQYSAGNPAYLRMLLAEQPALSAYLDLPRAEHADPACDYAVFAAELDGVAPEVRAVAEAAAVIGNGFELETVAGMLDRSPTAVLDAIAELIKRDLVRPVARAQHFAFRHPVVRRAVYHGTELGVRADLHARVDEILAGRDAPSTERAPHLVHRARHGDLATVDLLLTAGQAVTLTSPNTAAAWLRTALRILPPGAQCSQTRARLLTWLAKARGGSGYLRECRDILHEALRFVPVSSMPLHSRVVAFAAQAQRLLGTYAEADAMLRAELELIGPDCGSEAAGLLHFEMAAVELANGDTAATHRSAATALAIARRHDQSTLRSAGEGLRAMAHAMAGDLDAATACLDRATAALDGMLDARFALSTDAVVWIGWTDMLLERWDDALRHFGKAVDFATRSGHRLGLPHLLIGQLSALRNRGRLADAEAAVDHAVYLADESGSPEQLISAYAMRSWLATMLDRPDEAARADRMVAEHAKDSATGWCETLALRMLAEARLVSGNHDGCLTLATTVGGPNLLGADACSRVAWYELLTRAELAAGQVDAAARWAESASADAAMLAQPGRGALARQARTERRRLAARTQRAGDGGGAGLTRRERQVAEMVGPGLTNRMIAKRLHIAEKTVEMHLSNVFAKLGVSSRAAVAALISRERPRLAGAGRG